MSRTAAASTIVTARAGMRGARSAGHRGPAPARQRGVALLAAIILVAIAAVLAVTVAFDGAMSARRSSSAFAFEQSLQYARGAEALAAYALADDFTRNPKQDTLAERWAQPIPPSEIAPGVTLEAALEDLQGRFNLNDLVDPGTGAANADWVHVLEQLLTILELEPKWASMIADWIDEDSNPTGNDGAEDTVYAAQDPPYRTPGLRITSTSELLALPGFGIDRYRRLAPYVAALPTGTGINVCTAPGAVLDALSGQREYSIRTPEEVAKERQAGCWPTRDLFKQSFQDTRAQEFLTKYLTRIGETSNWFRLTSIVSIGTSEFALYNLLYRQTSGGARVVPVERTYGTD